MFAVLLDGFLACYNPRCIIIVNTFNFAGKLRPVLKDGVKNLVIDLKELDYVSSAGLRVLLSTRKTMDGQGEMFVRNANEAVMEVFKVTGFTNLLNIE